MLLLKFENFWVTYELVQHFYLHQSLVDVVRILFYHFNGVLLARLRVKAPRYLAERALSYLF